jgi:hypothetical protein
MLTLQEAAASGHFIPDAFWLFLCLFPSHEHMYISFRIDHSAARSVPTEPLNVILGIQHCYSHVAYITSVLVLICILKKKPDFNCTVITFDE